VTPVLIIDDDRDTRESLRDTLVDEGFAVDDVGTGAEGLAYLGEHDVCLVLLDWNMAPMDAPAFMLALRDVERARTTPVALLTADSRISSRGVVEGFVACLKKPVDLDTLFALVARYSGHDAR